MNKVEIYTSPFCGYCWAAKRLLDGKGIPYTEISATDPEVRADMTRRANGKRTVPQIFIGDEHVGGCDELHALDRAGGLDRMLAA